METNRNDLVLPELSYEVVGACFDAYNEIGPGQKEENYQKATAVFLDKRTIDYVPEVRFSLEIDNIKVGTNVLDFVIANSIVLELKVGKRFRRQDYDQIKRYLNHTGLPLGILARFDDNGVTFQRVLNTNLK